MAGPLPDVRVVELGQVVAGPFCGQALPEAVLSHQDVQALPMSSF